MLKILKRQKPDFENDDEDVDVAMVAAALVLNKRRKVSRLCFAFAQAQDYLLKEYVHFRGGLNACLNFGIPEEPVFQFETYCDKLFAQDFRFSKGQVNAIVYVLTNTARFPSNIVSYARDKADLRTALLMMCFKYAWPNRLGRLCQLFGKGISWISRIIKTLRETIIRVFMPKLRCPPPLPAEDLKRFASV
jgi:hypothetical protein